MQGQYKIITLCGSTRFKEEFLKVQKDLTLKGYIVISVGLFGHRGDDEVWEDGVKEMLDDMHLSKIDMADEIFVVNKDGYIGESTAREIAYALSCGKPVNSLCPLPLKELAKKKSLKAIFDKDFLERLGDVARQVGVHEEIILQNTFEEFGRN